MLPRSNSTIETFTTLARVSCVCTHVHAARTDGRGHTPHATRHRTRGVQLYSAALTSHVLLPRPRQALDSSQRHRHHSRIIIYASRLLWYHSAFGAVGP